MRPIQFPKIKLTAILTVVFLAAVFVELLAGYRYVYQNLRSRPEAALETITPVVKFDSETFDAAKVWLKDRKAYQMPRYSLEEKGLGRENPFAEYK